MAEILTPQEAVLLIDAIPTPGATAARLLELAQDPESTTDAFVELFESDPGVAAQLMRGANDPQRHHTSVLDVREAVEAVGRDVLERLAFSAVTPDTTGVDQDAEATSGMPSLRRHALASAIASRRVAELNDHFAAGEAYGAALLSSLGTMAMATLMPEQAGNLRRRLIADDEIDLPELERQLFGFDREQMSTALLEAWDFSLDLRDAFYFQHRSMDAIECECPPQLQDIVGFIRAGAHVAAQAGFQPFDADAEEAPPPDVRALLEGVDMEALVAHVQATVESVERAAAPVNADPAANVRSVRVANNQLVHLLARSEHQRQAADAVTSVMRYGLERLGDGDPLPGLMYRTMEFMGFKRMSYVEIDKQAGEMRVKISAALRGSNKVPEGSSAALPSGTEAFSQPMIVTKKETSAEAGDLLALLGIHACVLAPITNPDGEVGGFLVADRGLNGLMPVAGDERYLGIIANQGSLLLRFEELSREQARMATIDPLTGAATRRKLMDRLEHLISLSDRTQIPLSMAIMDLDHFKSFNDTLGHQVGDRLLQDVVKVFEENVRETDLVARYGGEEFIVVFADAKLDGAWTVAEKLREKVFEFGLAHAEEYDGLQISISIGVAQLRVDEHGKIAEDAMALIGRADEVLYKAKHNGRNRVERAA